MSEHDITRYWPFCELPEAAGRQLSTCALELELRHDDWLFHLGDPADALFVLVDGQLDFYQGDPPQWRKRLEPGTCVGELPLVVGGPRVRSGSIRAFGPCKLLGLGYGDLRRLLTRRVFDSLLTPVTQRHLASLELGLSTLFGRLTLPLLVEIEAAMVQRQLRTGETLFEKGDSLEHVWLVEGGRLEVLIERDGELQRVAELGPGQPVGELAVLIGGERSATVRALRDTWLRGLSAATFEALLMRHPGAAVGLAKTLARRLMRANQQPVVVDRPRTLVLLAASAQLDLQGIATSLIDQLQSTVVVLERDSFTAEAPDALALDDDPSRRRFSAWLSIAEDQHDAVILLAGPTSDGWTRACVGAADEVVLVATVDDSPELTEIEKQALTDINDGGEVTSLVLCRPPGTASREDDEQLEPWLMARPKLVHLHEVALGDRRDFSRLGRGLFRS